MKKVKEKKEPKYEIGLVYLPWFLRIIFCVLFTSLISGPYIFMFLPLDFFEEPLRYTIIGGYTFLIILVLVIWFSSKRRIVYTLKSNTKMNRICIFCSREIKSDELYILCPVCKEPMHFSELTSWLETKNRCPKCKMNLKKVLLRKRIDHHDEYPERMETLEKMLNDV